jgi:hypothetical protein
VKPAAHLQSVKASLPAGELELVGQFTHAASPGASLYLPSAHAEHAAPSGPV